MNETNETVEDIITEMRYWSQLESRRLPHKSMELFADRIEAAYRRDMKTIADEVVRLKKQVSELCHFGVCRSEKCSCCENATKEIEE